MARPLSAGRMMIVSFLPSDFNTFLYSLLTLDLGGFADFKVPFLSARKLAVVCLWYHGASLFSGYYILLYWDLFRCCGII